jgi:signal transduction histidine kinase
MNATVTDADKQVVLLLDCQRRVLEQIATGVPLKEILETLVRLIEAQAEGMRCVVVLPDSSQGRLAFAAGPSLPEAFKADMEPYLRIALGMAPCGAAAFQRTPVYVRDTAAGPRSERWREVAVRHGFRAAWSTPILSDDNTVLGTFAMLYGEPRSPAAEDIQLIDMAVQMARVAIQRREAQRALEDSARELQALTRRLVDVQESERRELSRELHDRVGQSLTALAVNLRLLGRSVGQDAAARLEDSQALLESTAEAIENVTSELRPPMLDDAGLFHALSWYGEQFSRRSGIAVNVTSAHPEERIEARAEIALFRIAQEALNNVLKHAGASRVEIVLERGTDAYVMTVRDDGVGLDAPSGRPGLGMVTMRERAQAVGGSFSASRSSGRGTRLEVVIPC